VKLVVISRCSIDERAKTQSVGYTYGGIKLYIYTEIVESASLELEMEIGGLEL